MVSRVGGGRGDSRKATRAAMLRASGVYRQVGVSYCFCIAHVVLRSVKGNRISKQKMAVHPSYCIAPPLAGSAQDLLREGTQALASMCIVYRFNFAGFFVTSPPPFILISAPPSLYLSIPPNALVLLEQASLTESTGPVWHVVATRGAGDWSYSVAFEEGQLIDFKVRRYLKRSCNLTRA